MKAVAHEELRDVHEVDPRLRHTKRTSKSLLEATLLHGVFEQIASDMQQADVEVARHLHQASGDPRQLRGPREQILGGSRRDLRVNRRQPLRLRRRIFGMRGEQIDARVAGLERVLHVGIELGVREPRDDLDV
jgi:hypothetical protein